MLAANTSNACYAIKDRFMDYSWLLDVLKNKGRERKHYTQRADHLSVRPVHLLPGEYPFTGCDLFLNHNCAIRNKWPGHHRHLLKLWTLGELYKTSGRTLAQGCAESGPVIISHPACQHCQVGQSPVWTRMGGWHTRGIGDGYPPPLYSFCAFYCSVMRTAMGRVCCLLRPSPLSNKEEGEKGTLPLFVHVRVMVYVMFVCVCTLWSLKCERVSEWRDRQKDLSDSTFDSTPLHSPLLIIDISLGFSMGRCFFLPFFLFLPLHFF